MLESFMKVTLLGDCEITGRAPDTIVTDNLRLRSFALLSCATDSISFSR